MSDWYNKTGKALSSASWLEIHHKAKLYERKAFLNSIIDNSIETIIDIGCGPGLWLELVNDIACSDCEVIGVDSDSESLNIIRTKSSSWSRKVSLLNYDVEKNIDMLPKADIIFVFNMFCYIKNPIRFLNQLQMHLKPNGKVVVRQYDGGTLRFGPMDESARQLIDSSLFSAISLSEEFHHYDLDRVFSAIESSNFKSKKIEFELYQKTAPYSKDVKEYIDETIRWTCHYISENAHEKLLSWYENEFQRKSYLVEVDLVSILS